MKLETLPEFLKINQSPAESEHRQSKPFIPGTLSFMTPQTTFGTQHPVAFITGSLSPRVGRVIADRFASTQYHVILHGHRLRPGDDEVVQQIGQRAGVPAMAVHGDVSGEGVAEQWIDQIVSRFGRLDVMVNSAAIWSPTKINDVTPEELRRYFEINTIAPFLLSRAAANAMASNQLGGAIVNIGDWATTRPYVDHAAYFPSKSAIEGMTRSLAVEFAQINPCIRVNCVQPGPVLLADDVDDQTSHQLAAATLVGRVGTPEAIAHAVEFLCVNDFTTGICLVVDGGRSVFSPDGLQVGRNTG